MEIPSAIGKYHIIERLGEGASGCVLKARQQMINRVVALKILFAHLLRHKPVLAKRFRREARLACSLVHPNIVPIFEIAEADGLHYYTMQYIEGTPMLSYIKSDVLDLRQKVELFIELCDALALAHSRNIIHRDLKPHNVMITKDFHPVILDFGIAKSLIDEDNMTQAGHILGSAHYMAPEQASPQDVGTATDVFGLGVMMYEMIAGERPFQGSNVKDLIVKRIEYGKDPQRHRPPSMREINAQIPEKLDAIVFRCLEANPKNRYDTAGELLHDLKNFHKELLLSRLIFSRPQAKNSLQPINARKSYCYPALLALAVLLLLTVFSIGVWHSRQPYLSSLRKIQAASYQLLRRCCPCLPERRYHGQTKDN